MAAITLDNVQKAFGNVTVIRDVDLEIGDKEFVVFVGPSGCGKSTLLRLVAGLEDVTAGRIAFDGEDVTDLTPAERGIAMVFQSYALYPHMSVYDNMAFGLKLAKLGRRGIDERVRGAARILQLEPLLARKPRELSGGQRQRVAIGRAIVRDPRVFLFDEPLSNLDAALRVQMRIEIARLHRDLNATMIYVTHDQIEAMTLADRIVILNAGRVEQVGSPTELYESPRNLFVAGFIGSPSMNFIVGRITSRSDEALMVGIGHDVALRLAMRPEGALPGQRVTLGLRPEHLTVGSGGDARLEGRVLSVERLGAESYLYVERGSSEPLVVKSAGLTPVRADDVVSVGVPAAACYLFDEQGRAIGRPALS